MVWVGSVQVFVVYAVSVSRSVCKPNFPFVNFSREIVGGCTFDYVFDSIRGVRPNGNGKGIREPSSHLYDTVYPFMSHTDHLRICVGNSYGTECDTNVPIVRHQIRLRYPVVDTRADSAGRDVRSHRSPHVRRVVTGVSPRR